MLIILDEIRYETRYVAELCDTVFAFIDSCMRQHSLFFENPSVCVKAQERIGSVGT